MRFQAYSLTIESLSMELRGRVIPKPWPLPLVRTSLEMEAGLLDSDVQELLGAKELTGDELGSGLQLQWATQAEFPIVVKSLELNCCAIPLTEVEAFCSACRSGRWTRLGNAGERSRCASHR